VGVTLGVGLFSGVLFFIDGSAASMTKRAIAPLTLDMQRVLTAPLGRSLTLGERLSAPDALLPGQLVNVTLTVTNSGPESANEVVVNDEPPPPLTYMPGTTTLNGAVLADIAGRSALAQGAARSGYNIGRVGSGEAVTLAYAARATSLVDRVATLPLGGTISSRESVVPVRANSPQPLTLEQLLTRIARIPGVAAADGLSFVDLPPGSLRRAGMLVAEPVRVFAFDRNYQRHYPSIRVVAGSFRSDSALLSAEASRGLSAAAGATVELTVPGRSTPLSLPVSGVTDLARAQPLFSSRKTSKLDDFLYVPNSVIVSPAIFRENIIPAYRSASAQRGSTLRTLPVLEADVLVERGRLHSDPGRALAQTKAVAGAIGRIAPSENSLIDNISNSLAVARDDAVVGKRMFVFLGLPAVLLAAFLAAYAGAVLASSQRRENAMLRVRGANRGHLRRMLVYRTLAFAGVGSALGAVVGFICVMVILGPRNLLEASARGLVASGLAGAGIGMVTTALALYVPGRRSLGREINQERRELAVNPAPAWRRWRLDFVFLGMAAIVEIVALRAGAFDTGTASVSAGRAVSLPSHLLLAPLVAWLGGMLLVDRIFESITSRLPTPAPPRFGPVLRGTLGRSLKRRSWAFATGIVGVGLVIAFGISIAIFAATYDDGKVSDSRFVVGSNLRVTHNVLSPRPLASSFATKLRVQGVSAVAPVVFKLENSVVIGPYNQDRKDLAAIDPASFRRAATLSDSFFADRSATDAMAALETDRDAILLDTKTAEDLSIPTGSRVQVLLARGTPTQSVHTFRVVGRFHRVPGFPQGVNVVSNLATYQAATSSDEIDFFVARASDGSHAALAGVVKALRDGPGQQDPINIDTTETALHKDQSSLTALNVHGLVDLDSLFTLLMSAAGIAIFVFGLMLQRRREYVTLRAQGMHTQELRALVMAEAALVALCGLAAGMLVGAGMSYLLVHILRPLFILDPHLAFPVGKLITIAALAIAATLASALAGSAILNRLRPTELLREA
jgi:putative ABC transport system permease protein